jgi:hypothetical protein
MGCTERCYMTWRQITEPPYIEEYCEQRRQRWKPIDDAGEGAKKPITLPRESTTPNCGRNLKFPPSTFFAPLRSTEIQADNAHDADDTTEFQHHQAPFNQAGRPPPIVLTSHVNMIQLQRQLKGLPKGNFISSVTPETGPRAVTKERRIFQSSSLTSKATTSHISPFIPNLRSL